MTRSTWLFFVVCFIFNVKCYIVNPGPSVIATKGEAWPKPRVQQTDDRVLEVNPFTFTIEKTNTSKDCKTLTSAISRYTSIIKYETNTFALKKKKMLKLKNFAVFPTNRNVLGVLRNLSLTFKEDCNDDAYPDVDDNENYTLSVKENGALLEASTVWGILRGLETFSQLLYPTENGTLHINITEVVDFPRFSHRGLLLDTSRHYIPTRLILELLDAMSYNKMNVFHWHIVDDQSFPYYSKRFPELSEKGAYEPDRMIYTPSDVDQIIEYARERGIRVVPEFDTPGHTRSWGLSHPELLTECPGLNPHISHILGPVDPTKNFTYTFMKELFGEIKEVFKDSYIHLGGDEVGFECWQNNTNVTSFMKMLNISGDYTALEEYYVQRIIDMAKDLNFKPVVWEEVFTNGVRLPNDTIVHVWKDEFYNTLAKVTASGNTAILSSCWYLDHLDNGGDWQKYYSCEPLDFAGTPEQKNLVIGGEACMWSEVVDEHNVISRIWPRASAIAERLWSSKEQTDASEAARRLEEHTCRMVRRGIGAQPPNGPGFCL